MIRAVAAITATKPGAMTNMIAVMISTPSVTEYNTVKWSRFWTELSIYLANISSMYATYILSISEKCNLQFIIHSFIEQKYYLIFH